MSMQDAAARFASVRAEPPAGIVTTTRFAPRLVVRQLDRLLVVRVDEVDWFEAEGNHVVVHARAGRHLFRHSLGALWDKLDPARFARANRSAIVNLDAVTEVEFTPGGGCELLLRGGERLVLSRRCRQGVLTRLGMV